MAFSGRQPPFPGCQATDVGGIRKAAGMIQLDLAKAVEINRVTVSDIERGKLQPGAEPIGKYLEY